MKTIHQGQRKEVRMARRGRRMAVGLMGISLWAVSAPWLCAESAYGRACLVVEEASSDDPPLITTTVLGKDAMPGPGKRVILYADSSVDLYVLAAAFNDKDRRLTNGWRPQFVALRAGEEQRLPLEPVTWQWTGPAELFDVYVVFLSRAAQERDSLQTLVSAMQDPHADPVLRDLQAKKLYEELARLLAGQEPAAFHAGAVGGAWGGTLRGSPFPWPTMAQKVAIGADGRGVLLYRHGR
jgi:hypothetical protein